MPSCGKRFRSAWRAGAPTACLASGSGLTLIRIAKTPGGTSAQVYHRAGDVRCPRIHRIRQGRTGLLEMHNDRLETRCFQKPSILIDRAPGGVILFIRTPRSLEALRCLCRSLASRGIPVDHVAASAPTGESLPSPNWGSDIQGVSPLRIGDSLTSRNSGWHARSLRRAWAASGPRPSKTPGVPPARGIKSRG